MPLVCTEVVFSPVTVRKDKVPLHRGFLAVVLPVWGIKDGGQDVTDVVREVEAVGRKNVFVVIAIFLVAGTENGTENTVGATVLTAFSDVG